MSDTAFPIGEIKDSGFEGTCQLRSAVVGLLTPQKHPAVRFYNTENIGAGIRHDHFQGLLLVKSRVQKGVKTVKLSPFQFKFHMRLSLLVRVSSPVSSVNLYVQGAACMSLLLQAKDTAQKST